MWVKIITDQIKAGGIYLKGQNMDLPERIVEKFDEGSYEPTCAPWDKNVPPEQLRLRAAEASYKAIKARAEQLQLQIESTNKALSDLDVKHSLAIEDLDKAAKELENAKKTIKKATDTKAAEKEVARKAAEEPDLPIPPEAEDIYEHQSPKEAKDNGTEKAKGQKQKSKAKSKTD